YGVAAFGDRLRRVNDRAVQLRACLGRALRQQVGRRLELEQQTVKALKQRIVQLPREPSALVDAFVEALLVLACDLADATAVARPRQTEGRGHDERLEPPRLVIRRRDRE